jgi:hypothetical protein
MSPLISDSELAAGAARQAAIRACLAHAGWRFEKVRQVLGTRRTARFYVKETL